MSSDSSHESHEPESKPRQPSWIVGGVLVLLGVVFLVRAVTGLELHNWWALFILIPALGSLVAARQQFVRNGRQITAASRGPLIGGLVLSAIAAIFLFEIDWAIAWPFILIIAGAGVLLSALRGKR